MILYFPREPGNFSSLGYHGPLKIADSSVGIVSLVTLSISVKNRKYYHISDFHSVVGEDYSLAV
jgi:hypothetical protein